MKIKEQLYKQCKSFIENRLKTVQETIAGIQESLLSETKSSAGDKHETGRAMLQLEREKAGKQLAEIQKTNLILSKIDYQKSANKVSLGSIIYTNKVNYFIAISAGVIEYNNESFYAISANTPIAQLLMSKVEGDTVAFRDNNFTITKVL
ncbi:3-oxoacyl-ACP synthase [Lacinutrix sp. MedPE-SW]|uniref:3-oxoacyl-ACP synthase n=1 Tax=Lacinutrix sp. MedPE-SW TaxID=1860087 RepID=UPI0009176913|nr:3-oxoacyl-ACP synthase [Lacinutrix sp. MedPE-SW]OIQ23398.1 MAG: 3-oxoacyl-ACP synthase [Lacinutrix sp. MedPE-SW]